MGYIAIGTNLAPVLATIYTGNLEEGFLQSCFKKPLLWVRYTEDIFMIWTHSLDDFDEFLVELNKIHQKIHFTANAPHNPVIS